MERTTSPHPKIKGYIIALLVRLEGLVHDYLGNWSGEIGAGKRVDRDKRHKKGIKKIFFERKISDIHDGCCFLPPGGTMHHIPAQKERKKGQLLGNQTMVTHISITKIQKGFPANAQPGFESRQARQWVLSWLVKIWEQTFALCIPNRWGFRQPRHLSSHHLFPVCRSWIRSPICRVSGPH